MQAQLTIHSANLRSDTASCSQKPIKVSPLFSPLHSNVLYIDFGGEFPSASSPANNPIWSLNEGARASELIAVCAADDECNYALGNWPARQTRSGILIRVGIRR